ncbi:hypothetical protein PVAP13_5KG258007 [Panicum virgatum]|uniref:Uncharacterized protein n=1 Tax=Panicum virgatum TaxID=38727 RepID=A0A8T0SML0_PANVG|nr:hypothetical protein PVAP13_5KG258007 [Panicum virgatum]
MRWWRRWRSAAPHAPRALSITPGMKIFFSSSRKRRLHLQAAATHAAVLATTRRHRKWGGSVPEHKVLRRDREGAWAELVRCYFASEPLFDDTTFRRR